MKKEQCVLEIRHSDGISVTRLPLEGTYNFKSYPWIKDSFIETREKIDAILKKGIR